MVVGAGSAGCVLAHDLSVSGNATVLVVEAGPSDRHPYVRIPLGYGLLYDNPTRNYRLHTQAEANLAGRRLYVPRGRVVGGSGSINAMVWCRGLPSDYADWARDGLTGWGWDDVAPVFDSLEARDDAAPGIRVTDPVALRHPFTRHFRDAARELRLPCDTDFNGNSPEGMGFYNITTRKGQRDSSAQAFLRPAIAGGLVRLLTGAQVQKITVAGSRATGIAYSHRGKTCTAQARRGVVMAAGAIGTPQIMHLSGIGDGNALQSLGIATHLHNPNVGRHLQDHLAVGYAYRAHQPTLNAQLYSLPAKVRQTLRYFAMRQGPLANSVNQYGGFLRSADDLAAPDQQLYLNPASYTITRSSGGLNIQPDPFAGYSLSFQPTRPTSRGHIAVATPIPGTAPDIVLNALSTAQDCHDVVVGARLLARFVQTRTLQTVTDAPLDTCPARMTDAEILDDFRARAGTVFHPCGTCRMGPNATGSVVDPRSMAVHGMEGLYVADASTFPSIPSGNINAPTLMVARKGARLILQHNRGSL
nr:GMC family oxidoreductase N-terminal domain-containing protein [Roseovarius sp. ZX-A-9]